MSVSKNDVRAIAKLASIRLTEEEEGAMASELGAILTWIEQLKECDISGVVLHSAENPPLEREDLVTEAPQTEAVLANAPDVLDAWFAVPKVL
ncbi:aspartyl/glutamyl-tRNA(Asn/Gln) amidotransferase subunit C [Alphaproteobacteria bacterium]|nr:aspartyl/glutamyl-tRNA(Asn/Gln) amidotransferase subunit C [Alphaproteobacteria bacterium]GHS96573.1 aspartyl/glutamyl-tRNA(Asn/Gln) amidotransferase subunit C [Alphaproteobacteria bacterium]